MTRELECVILTVEEAAMLRAEVERLQAEKLKLTEENLQLRQIIDGYARAKP